MKDPKEIVQAGQVVKVKVMEVNKELKRIGLSMKVVDGLRRGRVRNRRWRRLRRSRLVWWICRQSLVVQLRDISNKRINVPSLAHSMLVTRNTKPFGIFLP